MNDKSWETVTRAVFTKVKPLFQLDLSVSRGMIAHLRAQEPPVLTLEDAENLEACQTRVQKVGSLLDMLAAREGSEEVLILFLKEHHAAQDHLIKTLCELKAAELQKRSPRRHPPVDVALLNHSQTQYILYVNCLRIYEFVAEETDALRWATRILIVAAVLILLAGILIAFIFPLLVNEITTKPFSPSCRQVDESSPQQENKDADLFDLLDKGSNFFKNVPILDEAILLLGNTGSGKSTLGQLIGGDLDKMHAVESKESRLVIIDDDNHISLPASSMPKTFVPNLLLTQDHFPLFPHQPLKILDCPGFDVDDSRVPVDDIAVSYFISQIPKHVKTVKMLFLVLYSSTKGAYRLHFDKLAANAANFMKSQEKFINSFALIITAVDNYTSRGEYIEDNQVILETVHFLRKYLEKLNTTDLRLRDDDNVTLMTLRKIAFVNAILRQDEDRNFPRIWFIRSPSKCGRFNNLEEMVETKRRIFEVVENLEFKNISEEQHNMGFELKPEAQELIHRTFTKDINTKIESAVSLVTKELATNYFNKIQELYKPDKQDFGALARVLKRDSTILETIVDELKTKMSSASPQPSDVTLAIHLFMQHVGNPPSLEFESFMTSREQYLAFFDNATTQRTVERFGDQWIEPIMKFQKELNMARGWVDFCIQLEQRVNSYQFQNDRPPLPSAKDRQNWIGYIDKHGIISPIDSHISETTWSPTSAEKCVLETILEFGLDNHEISCSTSGASITTLTVKGNFLVLSKVVQIVETACAKRPTSVHLLAGHTIFLDEDVNLEGIDMTVLAPIWRNARNEEWHLRVGGKAGQAHQPPAAQKGEANTGESGLDGCAGKPGDPGGSIFGVGGEFISESKLRIQSMGGTGGPGQNGGDGGSGITRDAAFPSQTYPDRWDDEGFSYLVGISPLQAIAVGIIGLPAAALHVARNRVLWVENYGVEGGNGGNGGNGGRGGVGGLPGQVEILALRNSALLDTVEVIGLTGEHGLGGKGGPGGFGGKGYYCTNNEYEGFPGEWICHSKAGKVSAGAVGLDGSSAFSTLCSEQQKFPRQITKSIPIVIYKSQFINQANPITTQFVLQLETALK